MKIALYKPSHIFNFFLERENIVLFSEDTADSADLVICPVFWGLSSIDYVLQTDYHSALQNTDQQGYHNPLIPPDIVYILKTYNAKLLLYNDWEARHLDGIHRELLYFTKYYLKQPLSKVIYSTTSYTGHMKRPLYPHILSYDWMHLLQKAGFDSSRVIANKSSKKYPLLSLNYRGNMERYAFCFYLFQKHRGKALFSYLDFPANEAARKLNEEFKALLGTLVSEKNLCEFNEHIPHKIDGDRPTQHQTDTLRQYFEQSYIHVMFETNWLPLDCTTQQISEKSYLNIRTGKPFILFTTAGGVLAHLRSLGYKTFSPFINEDYDNPKLTYYDRFKCLLEETDRICSLNTSELEKLDRNLRPIVEHNLKEFSSNKSVPIFFEMIDERRLTSMWFHIQMYLGILSIYLKRADFWVTKLIWPKLVRTFTGKTSDL